MSPKLFKIYNTSNTINNNNSIEDYSDIDNDLDELSIDNRSINLEENTSKDLVLNNEKLLFNNNSIELLYNRLGHINLNAIKKLKDNTIGINLDLKDINNARITLDNCIICIKSKLTKNINKDPSTLVLAYLDLIYIDIGGPIKPKTFRGYKYYITFRDAFSKFLVVKLLKSRKDIIKVIEETITELELEAKDNNSNIIIK